MSNTEPLTKPGLLGLIRAGDVDRLQVLFDDERRAFEHSGDETVFSRALERYPSDLASGLEIARRWLERHPDSYAAHLVLAECVFAQAYAKRGRSFSHLVSDYGWDSLNAGLAESYALRLKAVSLSPRPLHAWVAIGRLYRFDARYGAFNPGFGIPKEEPSKPDEEDILRSDLPYWYKQAIAMNPASKRARSTLIAALEPRWCGSMEAIRAFLALPHPELDAADRAALEAEALLFEAGVLELSVESWTDDVETLDGMEALYRTALSRHASTARRALASFCWSRERREEAADLYRRALEDDPHDGAALLDYGGVLTAWPERFAETEQAYQRAADLGHLRAWREIGDCLSAGSYGYPQDPVRALEYYRQGYAEGDLESGYRIAVYHQERRDPVYPELWRELAARGHAFAATRMADMRLNGRGEVEPDLEAGHEFLMQSVHLGSPEGHYLLACRLQDGSTAIGEDGNLVAGRGEAGAPELGTALNLLRRSAELCYARAMGRLGESYRAGRGVKADRAEADRWFRAAADADLEDIHGYNLEAFEAAYEPQAGRPDPAAAAVYLRRSAYGPDGYGRLQLAWHLLEGRFAFDAEGELRPHRGKVDERNEAIALDLYAKLAEEGDESAINNLGAWFEGREPKRAFEYYLRAAELEFAHAQTQVGRCYLQGVGVGKDRGKAIEWLERAERNGDENAAYWLGKAHSIWGRLFA